jgi:RimJ/RimL family protein N-acetyltransferase
MRDDSPASHPPIRSELPDAETERLLLSRFKETDAEALSAVFAKREVWQFPYGRAFTRQETESFLKTQIEEWDRCGFGCWLATEKATRRVVGYVGISVPHFLPEILPAVEVGWRFDPDVWGKGYATEGATCALGHSFTTLGLDEICSVPQADNPPSVKVCERLGMRLDRVVDIPANDKRGELKALLFYISAIDWRNGRNDQD